MAFTFDPEVSGFTDRNRVRWGVGDTDADYPIFTDELIDAVLTDNASESVPWQHTVIDLLENLVSTLAHTPDFQADWLRVDQSKALAALEKRLAAKKAQYGIDSDTITIGGAAVYPTRNDRTSADE